MVVLSHETTVPVPPYPIEGAGNPTFSVPRLAALVLGVPFLICYYFNFYFWVYPFVALITALPILASTIYFYSNFSESVLPQTVQLPGRNIEDYVTIKDGSLQGYKGKTKIPMETLFEGYIAEKIDVKGDVFEVLEHRYDFVKFGFTMGQFKFFLTQWIPELLWHSKRQDQDQVREHYDRGNDFYEWFLGPSMVYTSGVINDMSRRETLEELQDNKMNLICQKINVQPGDKHLDIGCGWGTLAIHAAKKFGSTSTGVTLAKNQTSFAEARAKREGVEDKVNFLCMDYRDIPKQRFDKITCVEMAEHVGVRRFQTFLLQVKELLTDDGVLYMQLAGLRRTWQYEDFIWGLFMAKYIFPGADASCPLNWYIEQFERAGFEVESIETVGVHYSATLERWYLNWMSNKDKVIKTYGVRWFRLWEWFLAWSSIVARQAGATCYQIVLHKNRNAFDRTIFAKRLRREDQFKAISAVKN